ncbi:MAG: hypothetical protein OHK0029_25750 [Armatimonadaceae bacterium]
MGDKSPKSARKQSQQKLAKTNEVQQKKDAAQAAKQSANSKTETR